MSELPRGAFTCKRSQASRDYLSAAPPGGLITADGTGEAAGEETTRGSDHRTAAAVVCHVMQSSHVIDVFL